MTSCFRLISCLTPSPYWPAPVLSSSSWERVQNLSIRVVIIYRGGAHLVCGKFSSCGRPDPMSCRNILASYLVWLAATRTAKLIPHLWTRPQDIVYVPAFILFGYYFAIMKVYALLTLHEVSIPVFAITLGTLPYHVPDRLGYPCWRR